MRTRLAGGAALAAIFLVLLPGTAHAAPAAPNLSSLAELRDQIILSAPPGSSSYVDKAARRVVLRIAGTASTALAATVGRQRGQVVLQTGASPGGELSGIVGGHEIDGPLGPCTAGFMALDQWGDDYVVTAGHCVVGGGGWRRNGKRLGHGGSWINSLQGDFGSIVITHNFTGQARVNSENGGSLGIQPVWGIEALPVPTSRLLCKMGRTTRYTCGSVLNYDVTVTTRTGKVIGGLIETNLCAKPGDSGAPLFTTMYVSNPPAAMAVGIASLGTDLLDCSNPAYKSWYQPIGEALDTMGLTLMTA